MGPQNPQMRNTRRMSRRWSSKLDLADIAMGETRPPIHCSILPYYQVFAGLNIKSLDSGIMKFRYEYQRKRTDLEWIVGKYASNGNIANDLFRTLELRSFMICSL